MKTQAQVTIGGMLMLSTALAFGVFGCGSQKADPAPASSEVTSESTTGTSAVVAQTTSAAPPVQGSQHVHTDAEIEGPVDSPDAMPPDVAISSIDTLVTPGTVVAISVAATPDVEEVTLSDAIGHRQPMTFDSSEGRWRTHYRVPLSGTKERIGLSVTARNGQARWRRVWVFLHVQREADEVKLESVEEK